MGLRDRLSGGGKSSKESESKSTGGSSSGSRGGGRTCMFGHQVPRGKKMCEHRHYIG